MMGHICLVAVLRKMPQGILKEEAGLCDVKFDISLKSSVSSGRERKIRALQPYPVNSRPHFSREIYVDVLSFRGVYLPEMPQS
jgi:hypothetical protein